MGLFSEAVNGDNIARSKSKARRRVLNGVVDDGDVGVESRCWIKFRFFGSCLATRAKVESSASDSSSPYGNTLG